jgi:hypothetical protein
MKKNKKTTIELIILLIIILIIYIGVVYHMRDKSGIWCGLSLGNYKKNVGCGLQPDDRCKTLDSKICSGGFFDMSGNRYFIAMPGINAD